MPDLVNCAHLAEESARLERVFELGELPRLADVLADPRSTLWASFKFTMLASGRPGATVRMRASPVLTCQRCMQGFSQELSGVSEVEFAGGDEPESADTEREFFRMENGLVSLRELAEEELLLALPIAPACSVPLTCGNAPKHVLGEEPREASGDLRRPFGVLQDLLKKT